MKSEQYILIVKSSLTSYIDRYNFEVFAIEDGVQLVNNSLTITIGYKYQEFEMVINDGKTEINISDLLLLKYPNYFKSDIVIFDIKNLTGNQSEDFKYLLTKSFDFIANYFPQIFDGILPTII